MSKKDKNNKLKASNFGKLEIIVFILYIIVAIIISIHHETSIDEAQSWLIARDLNPIEIIAQMKYEGHSPIWYFLILPFAKMSLSIEIQKIIPLIFSIAAVFIILKKSPFNKLIKILLIFNPATVYYNLFARPYCMILFFLVCIATIYKERKKHPYKYALYIGLLANTHLIMLPTCAMLTLFFWIKELIFERKNNTKEENQKIKNSFILLILIMLPFIIIIMIAVFNCVIVKVSLGRSSYESFFKVIINNWFYQNVQYFGFNQQYCNKADFLPFTYCYIIIGLILLYCLVATKYSKKQGIIFWIQYVFVLILHSFFWFPLPSRTYILIYTLMFFVWVYRFDYSNDKEYKKNVSVELAFLLLLVSSTPGTYVTIYQDLTKSYCSGLETANYIKNNIPKDSIIINIGTDYTQLIAGYLKKDEYKFYMANANRYVTFNIWDNKTTNDINTTYVKKIVYKLHKKNKDKNLYILIPNIYNEDKTSVNINNLNISEFKLKYEYVSDRSKMMDNKRVYDNVVYKIYKINFNS